MGGLWGRSGGFIFFVGERWVEVTFLFVVGVLGVFVSFVFVFWSGDRFFRWLDSKGGVGWWIVGVGRAFLVFWDFM